MTSPTGDGCQSNESNNLFPIEPLLLPLDSPLHIVFTGYFNGFNVEVKTPDEVALLYQMGCFGKGSGSRSKPRLAVSSDVPTILRKRQFLKRNYWAKKFFSPPKSTNSYSFFKAAKELNSKISRNSVKRVRKNVIDLVSSDEETGDFGEVAEDNSDTSPVEIPEPHVTEDMVVVVPDSDSEPEGDNYFTNLKPKCCINKIRLQEKLMLSLQEAFFLLYGLSCLQIVHCDEMLNIKQCWDLFVKTDKTFIPKYVVYHYFRAKGYVVKPGIKFGVLYKEGPEINHASHIVVVRTEPMNEDWISVLGHVRMAGTTVKDILIAEVIKPTTPHKFPDALCHYTVREMVLSRKIPESINDDED